MLCKTMTTRLCPGSPAVRNERDHLPFRGAQTPLRQSPVRRTLVVVVPCKATQKLFLCHPWIVQYSAKYGQSHIIVVTPCVRIQSALDPMACAAPSRWLCPDACQHDREKFLLAWRESFGASDGDGSCRTLCKLVLWAMRFRCCQL